ncbi:FAD-dependent oxidoreductase [Caulobacter vibrioides]|uniref:NAD(P)/FAD-dependent oxidoreductase n=1 Tax=Caulobacter vibrioides TaxID=155892 RepID=UPI000BB520C4|nr:FAD-dependent oxidoreductase [Caulobacter vibrioides]ATC25334.1 FAD-dependent oxidoreductase [Caulobacter vibrioides]AZH13423.1 FAD-dependent oxidoreductase [Caulobacter vibrioides]PLR14099.1 FAD-dependent oxidoreductase [Caulobacter vibrioides]
MKLRSGARIAVAGAGALGSAVALRLAQRGFRVTVFDPSPGDANASSVAAGMLAPVSEALFDPASRNHLDIMKRARDLWPDVARALGLGLERDGVRIEGSDAWRNEVASRLGALGEPAGVFIAEDWRIDARAGLLALRGAASEAGAVFRALAVRGFEAGVLELADGGQESFDTLILATGPGLRQGEIAPETRMLSPIKGQILRLAACDDDGAPVVRGEGVYLAPGAVLAVGATMEHGRDDLTPDLEATLGLRRAAATLRPDLDLESAKVEVGVRVTTPDGLPLVGWSRMPGVMLAVGARRNGWLFAPLVADMVAAYLTGDNLGPDAAAMDARRFEKPET